MTGQAGQGLMQDNGGAGRGRPPHPVVRRALEAARRREVAAVRDTERIVVEARMAGVPWSVIGDGLGVTRQAAQQRFASLWDPS